MIPDEHAPEPQPAAQSRRPEKRRRRAGIVAALVLAAAVVGTVVHGAAFQDDEVKQTPCEAAEHIIAGFRDEPPAVLGHLETNGSGSYSFMLRNLITGQYEDVDGVASPALAAHLRAVADGVGGVSPVSPADEFTTGPTGQRITELLTYCATAER